MAAAAVEAERAAERMAARRRGRVRVNPEEKGVAEIANPRLRGPVRRDDMRARTSYVESARRDRSANSRMLVRPLELFVGPSMPLTLPVGHRPQGRHLKGSLLQVSSLHRASAKARHVEGRRLFSPLRRSNLPEGMPTLPFAGLDRSVGFSPRGPAWLRWLGPAPL